MGAIHGRGYYDRIGLGEACFSGARGRCRGSDGSAQAASACAGSGVLQSTAALSSWPGGVRDGALLGAGVARAWPRGAADAGAIREGVHQAQQTRCRRCGSDLRGGSASDDALCAGQDGRPASCRAAAPWPGAVGAPAYGSGERFARASGRVWRDRAAGLAQRRQADRHCPRYLIFAPASTWVEPARQATKTIPIVFANHADPVGVGHVESLAHPGGNITGLSMVFTEIAAKELEILHEAVPNATRIGLFWNPTTPSHGPALRSVHAAAEALGVRLHEAPTQRIEDYDKTVSILIGENVNSFLVLASPIGYSDNAAFLIELALTHRLAGMFGYKENVQAGGLMCYSPDVLDLYRRSAVYIGKILKGAKPADLPVEQASKYELTINLNTARALGLTIPPMVLARADEVIE